MSGPIGYAGPKRAYGPNPADNFVDAGDSVAIRIGIIQRVDEINLKADVKILTGGGYRTGVDLTQAMTGPRSFLGGIPEVGSLVVLGAKPVGNKQLEMIILGFIPTGNRLGLRFDPLAPSDPNEVTPNEADMYQELFGGPVRYKRMKLAPGDVAGMSSSGAEFHLSRNLTLTNRAGDLIELRDDERTLVSQSVHRFEADAGIKRYSGPVRRQVFYLPPELFIEKDGVKTLRSPSEGYYGGDDLARLGPGAVAGSETKFATSDGKLLSLFNNLERFPPVTYSNGKTVFYPSTVPNISPEGRIDDGSGAAYTEVRTEIAHETDLVHDVHTEIDGFAPSPRRTYIEHVMGTVIGNDPYSTNGMDQYGEALRPQLWTSGTSMTQGKFTLEPVQRGTNGDLEVRTEAAAYLLRILGPETKADDDAFTVAVQKQGKVLVNVPKPTREHYEDRVKGVSAEVNLLGALKLYVGSSAPTNTSVYVSLAGGVKGVVGRNSDTGNSMDVEYRGPVRIKCAGTPDANGNGFTVSVSGNQATDTTGDHNVNAGGTVNMAANGAIVQKAEKIIQQAFSGYTLNSGGFQQTVTGETFLTHALLKTETIAAGGHIKTILAGISSESVVAGGKMTTASGPIMVTSGAGFDVAAGAAVALAAGGAANITAGGSASMVAGGSVSLTAGAVMTHTAPAGIMLTSSNIQLGGPTAMMGVARALPALPPFTPTLDYITGLPLLGSAMVRSI